MEHGLILGRYRPLGTLGEGAFARVDMCWDTRIQRRVAIKRLPLSATATGELPGLAEARTGAMLLHPSIVSVLDFEVEGDEALLIMEAIDGPTLADLIVAAPGHMLSLDVAAVVAHAVAEALGFAHDNQVLHLDVKPANILIDRAGRVRVSDFGVSELADMRGFGSAMGGTIGYMPLEQMCGDELDQRCDEFAFAAVLYELLCGKAPFQACTLDESAAAIRRFDMPAPSELRSDCSPQLDEVLLTALEPARVNRFFTVLDFYEALQPWLGSEKAGTAELKELAALDDETPEDTAACYDGESERMPGPQPLLRVVAFVLAGLLAGTAAAHSGLAGVPLSAGIGVVAGLVAAALPVGGGVVALACAGALGLAGGLSTAPQAGLPVGALGVCGAGWLVSAILMLLARACQTRVSSSLLCVVACAVSVAVAVFVGQACGTGELAALLVPTMLSVGVVLTGLVGLMSRR